MTIEYTVVHSIDGTNGIIEAVSQKIKEGWEPIGGVSASVIDFSEHGMPNANALYQAMVRRKD
ncbi:DUF1737 domain-containing protein [Niabella sp.]|uniref:DUF1737 domain-containing protein n=1 Tax=Niabella sp. TaxID=1962976 RepID=UPI002639252B|nr:DUF1737 domain-containing protein [Niabella sp.]